MSVTRVLTIIITSAYPDWQEFQARWNRIAEPSSRPSPLWEGGMRFDIDAARVLFVLPETDRTDDQIAALRNGFALVPGADVFLVTHTNIWIHTRLLRMDNRFVFRDYDHFSHDSADPVGSAILKLALTLDAPRFDAVVEAMRPRSAQTWLARLRHRLTNLFLPVDVDLQGWAQAGYDDLYAKELVKAHEHALARLADARTLLYPAEGESTWTLALVASGTANGDPLLKRICSHVPKYESEGCVLKKVLELIKSKEGLDQLREDKRCFRAFRDALADLDEALEALQHCFASSDPRGPAPL